MLLCIKFYLNALGCLVCLSFQIVPFGIHPSDQFLFVVQLLCLQKRNFSIKLFDCLVFPFISCLLLLKLLPIQLNLCQIRLCLSDSLHTSVLLLA